MTGATLRRSDACRLEPAFQDIKQAVIDRTGLGFYRDREDSLALAIAGRLEALRLGDCAAYRRCLLAPDGAAEWDRLVDEITIGETYFFRYPAQFDALRDHVLPELVGRCRDRRRLRIWSAGCASGAEPYSIAILLRLDLPHLVAGWDVSIVGTDISRGKLARAAAAEFSEWELRQVPDRYRQACFDRMEGGWRLRDLFRRNVSFQAENLVDDSPATAKSTFDNFDLILCRNVMIYFDGETIRRVARRLHDRLRDGGWLIVGHAEPHLDIANLFHPYPVADTTLYRKWTDRPVQVLPAVHDTAAGGWVGRLPPALSPPLWVPPTLPPVDDRRPAPSAPPRDRAQASSSVAVLGEARQLANAGDWAGATAQCQRLLDAEPLDADAHYLMALIASHRGEATAAEAALRRAIYIDRGFALAHYQHGRLAANRGDVAGAQRALRNVLSVLGGTSDDTPVRAGEGLTAGELKGLAAMHARQLDVVP